MIRNTILQLDKFVALLAKIFVTIAGVMILGMILITCYGVIMRYFLEKPEPISIELSTILLLWSFLFAIAYVELEDKQIKADIFTGFFPESVNKFLQNIVSPILAVIYCSILTWKGWFFAVYSYQRGELSTSIWGEPLYPIKFAIPVGYGLLTIVTIRNLIYGFKSYFPSQNTISDGLSGSHG